MQAMDGPINFGENDNFWGLLVEGFVPPSYGMNYNPPYYQSFLSTMGLKRCMPRLPITWIYSSRFPKGSAKSPIGSPKNRAMNLNTCGLGK